jgi:site-specific DNA-methyltransferase (adenine-specific)
MINEIELTCEDGLVFLKQVENGSVDLILTDPPYIISKDTGMNKHYEMVKENKKKGVKYVKTEDDWIQYKKI